MTFTLKMLITVAITTVIYVLPSRLPFSEWSAAPRLVAASANHSSVHGPKTCPSFLVPRVPACWIARSTFDDKYFHALVPRPSPTVLLFLLLLPFPLGFAYPNKWQKCRTQAQTRNVMQRNTTRSSPILEGRIKLAGTSLPDRLRGTGTRTNGDENDKELTELIAACQRDGYTLARHRTVTDEVTAAILRGPLVPTHVKRPLSSKNMPMQSNYGHDLAIFDPYLGLLDATYSNAWQLGRTLAMTDNAFCAALARLRNTVQGAGLDVAKREVHAAFGDDGHGSRQRAADKMLGLVQGLNQLHGSLGRGAVGENRWRYDDAAADEGIGLASINLLAQKSPHIAPRLAAHSNAAARWFAMAVPPDDDLGGRQQEDSVLYNEYNIPASPD